MISDNTGYLKLPLPHKDNYLEDDVPRLRDAFNGVDLHAQATDARLGTAEQKLDSTAADVDAAFNVLSTAVSKTATATEHGRVKLDAMARNGSATAAPGGFGLGGTSLTTTNTIYDANLAVATGIYAGPAERNPAVKNFPPLLAEYGQYVFEVFAWANFGGGQHYILQRASLYSGVRRYIRQSNAGVWTAWKEDSSGITDGIDVVSSSVAASATAVKSAYDRATAGVNTANATKAVTDLVTTVPAAWRIPQAGADGKLALGWIGGGGGMIPVGHIAFLPFRFNQLPQGWYFCNGTRYANGGAQANVLNALSNEFKVDWGITNNGSTTNVPNWFYGGRGPTMRGVDCSSRQVGSVEDGAIQNITGDIHSVTACLRTPTYSGAFYARTTGNNRYDGNASGGEQFGFDVSRVVATANEVKMLNRGMTPAIFLGV